MPKDLKFSARTDIGTFATMISLVLCLTVLVGMSQAAEDDPTNSCPPTPLDIGLIIDTSKSIKDGQLVKLREALVAFVSALDVGPQERQVRVSAAGFGKAAELYFDFDDYTNKEEVLEQLRTLPRVEFFVGTETGKGIRLMQSTFADSNSGERPAAPDVTVVFTDGKSTNPKDLTLAMKEFESSDIKQFAIGIGSGIDIAELTEIAEGIEGQAYETTGFDQLVALANTIGSEVTCVCTPICKRGQCIHETGICDCQDPRWGGDDCSKPVCTPGCQNGGQCVVDGDGNHICECPAEWTGTDCSEPVCDTECKNGGQCAAGTGGEGHSCACPAEWTGSDCSEPVCDPACQNGGECTVDGCECTLEFTGADCSEPVCDPACQNGGECTVDGCECTLEFTGADCSEPVCDPACQNGGECTVDGCECTLEFTGADCSEPVCDPACQNGGECTVDGCECTLEFTGADCSEPVCPENCSNGGSCVVESGVHKCDCPEGFTGDICSERECKPACVNGVCDSDAGECVCNKGYTGEDCNTQPPPPPPPPPPTEPPVADSCPSTPLDIHLVVDTSKSVKPAQFLVLREALVNFVDGLDIGPGDKQVRVALAGFAGVAERYFDFDDLTDKGEVKAVLADLERVSKILGTETGLGIKKMMETFSGDMGQRPNAKDISIVFTDGKSTNVKSLKQNLINLAETDIIQYAVGIGKGIQHDELLALAQGEESRLVQASTFDALLGLASTIAGELTCICSPVCKRGKCDPASGICKCPVGWTGKDCSEQTCEPACVNGECNKDTLKCECDAGFTGEDCSEQKCGIPERMELMLAIDVSNSLDNTEYAQIRKIAKTIVTKLNLGSTKTRVAVVKFGYKGVLQFGFSKYSQAGKMNRNIDRMGRQSRKKGKFFQTRTAQALNVAATHFNDEARPGVDRKMVVITDGMATDARALPAAVERVKAANIETHVMVIGDFMKPMHKDHNKAMKQLQMIGGDHVYTSVSFNEDSINTLIENVLKSFGQCS